MFGLPPIECDWDNPHCLDGGGGYILGPGDVFIKPNDKRYGFDNPPKIQSLPNTGFLPNAEGGGNGDNGGNPITQNANAIVTSLLTPNIQTIATGHPFLVLGFLAGVIYLIRK